MIMNIKQKKIIIEPRIKLDYNIITPAIDVYYTSMAGVNYFPLTTQWTLWCAS